MNQHSSADPQIAPELLKKLRKESNDPYLGLRRLIWLVFFASSAFGLFIMTLRLISGEGLPLGDAAIQISAFILFAYLVKIDREKSIEN